MSKQKRPLTIVGECYGPHGHSRSETEVLSGRSTSVSFDVDHERLVEIGIDDGFTGFKVEHRLRHGADRCDICGGTECIEEYLPEDVVEGNRLVLAKKPRGEGRSG